MRQLTFPDYARVLMIKRGNNRIIAIGKTKLAEGDAPMTQAGTPGGLLELKNVWDGVGV